MFRTHTTQSSAGAMQCIPGICHNIFMSGTGTLYSYQQR